jgi:holo-[acyl-carrier protein] synthase
MLNLRTGVDLVEIQRLEQVNAAIRNRFLERVFTPKELAETEGNLASLAGRFAAKEAVAKALGTGIGEVSWQEIEIRCGTLGEPHLTLFGAARERADQQGLNMWSLSISHTKDMAVAFAVAIGNA